MALGFLYGAGGGGGSQPEPEIKALIPVMTSDTAPSGVCTASSIYNSGSAAFHAFDGNTSATWSSLNSDNNSPYVAYAFPTAVVAKSIEYYNIGSGNAGSYGSKFKFQASNDGSTWIDISDEITQAVGGRISGTVNLSNNKTPYTNYRVVATETVSGLAAFEIQIYGYDPNYQPLTLYDRGSWNVGYDNPGGYTGSWTGWTIIPWTLGETEMAASSASGAKRCPIIGTTSKVDLTKYSVLHVKASVVNRFYIAVLSGKDVAGTKLIDYSVTDTSGYADIAIDVSQVFGAYNIALYNSSSSGGEVYVEKIWLT